MLTEIVFFFLRWIFGLNRKLYFALYYFDLSFRDFECRSHWFWHCYYQCYHFICFCFFNLDTSLSFCGGNIRIRRWRFWYIPVPYFSIKNTSVHSKNSVFFIRYQSALLNCMGFQIFILFCIITTEKFTFCKQNASYIGILFDPEMNQKLSDPANNPGSVRNGSVTSIFLWSER